MECSRCRTPLNDGVSRFNHTYGGLSHWACPARKVWPPPEGVSSRNVLFKLRQLAKSEVFASEMAQVHFSALVDLLLGRNVVLCEQPSSSVNSSHIHKQNEKGLAKEAVSSTTPQSVARTTQPVQKLASEPSPPPRPRVKRARPAVPLFDEAKQQTVQPPPTQPPLVPCKHYQGACKAAICRHQCCKRRGPLVHPDSPLESYFCTDKEREEQEGCGTSTSSGDETDAITFFQWLKQKQVAASACPQNNNVSLTPHGQTHQERHVAAVSGNEVTV